MSGKSIYVHHATRVANCKGSINALNPNWKPELHGDIIRFLDKPNPSELKDNEMVYWCPLHRSWLTTKCSCSDAYWNRQK